MARKNINGSTLIMAIIAIIVIGALGVGMQQMSSSAVLNQLMFNQSNQARNLAYSGVKYAKGLIYSYQALGKTFTQFKDDLTANSGVYDLGNNLGKFVITVPSNTTTGNTTSFTVSVLGKTPDGSFQSQYQLPSNVSLTYTYTPQQWNGGEYVISAGKVLNAAQNSTISGSISGEAVTLENGAVINGNIISASSVTLVQTSTVHGYVCASSGNVTVNNKAVVDGNVSANGYIHVVENAIIKQNAYATKYINMDNNSTIKLVGQAGEDIKGDPSKYVIGTPLPYTLPTVTCPSTNAPTAPTITNSGKIVAPSSTLSSPLPNGEYTTFTLNNNDSAYLKSGAYTFSSITTNNNANLYLDISSGGDLTILTTGNVSIAQNTNILIKTTTNGAYRSIVDNTSLVTPHSDAAHIYLGSNTNVTFNNGTGWFGTIYAKNSISIPENFILIGTLASPGTVSLNTGLNVIEYVLANYARSNWR